MTLSKKATDQSDSIKTYNSAITVFAEEMRKFCGKEPIAYQDANCEELKINGRQLTVELPRSRVNFTVTISIDNNCIELQTTPISYEIYKLNIDFINRLIFESAKNAGLEPATDKTVDGKTVYGGGGHISLDSQSAFAGDVYVLHEFIQQYTQEALKQVSKKGGLFSYNDAVNSPLMDIGALNGFLESQGKKIGDITDIEEYLNLLKTFYTEVTITSHKLKNDERIKEPGDISHYQAVNVDDFLGGAGRRGRIEMRNFDAQTDINLLLKQVDALYQILAQAYYVHA